MQRLVHIRLRHGDVVLEPARDRRVHLMDHAEGRVAVLDGLHDDADREEIVDLIQGLALVDHFPVDAEEMLGASADLGFHSGVFICFGTSIDDRN